MKVRGFRTAAALTLALALLASCAMAETEGHADAARATLSRYLAELGGNSDHRGWSVLSESMREQYGSRDDYVERADRAGEAELPVLGFDLVYEDDGFYEFTVTTAEPIDRAYADLLFSHQPSPRRSRVRPARARSTWP
jgi:hypothetical protein